MKNSQTRQNFMLILFAIFMVMFFPGSINGRHLGYIWIPRNFLALAVAVWLALRNNPLKKQAVGLVLLIGYLILLTVNISFRFPNGDFYVSVSSAVAELTVFLVWSIPLTNTEIREGLAEKTILVLSWIMLIWGWGLVFNNSLLLNFTRNFYNVLSEKTFNNMIVIRGKPVMSFGTHSMAAFFILLVFYLNAIVMKERRERNHFFQLITMVLLMALEIPLTSNTAILAMAVMVVLFIWSTRSRNIGVISVFILGIGIYYLFRTGSVQEYINSITQNANSASHGFQARYLNGIFSSNIEMILQYGGVGLLRSESEYIRMNDSAIVYLLTQGNIIMLITAYAYMYQFLKRSMVKYWRLTFAILFIWEIIATTTFIAPKMIFTQLLMVYLINNVVDGEEESFSYDQV